MRHITRLDYGYWVRFYRGASDRSKGTNAELYLHSTFRFDECGGVRKALKAAKAWRDEHYKQHSKLYRQGGAAKKGKPHPKARVDSSTDTVGVQRRVKWYEATGEYVLYVAVWMEYQPDGTSRQKSKTFSCGNKRTEEEAYEEAKRYRQKMERMHYRK
jgi:hypothetical protein|tara:strand:+ start:1032 stop:1505 length:474 start_codon:yes stop_codon:yes gene_type:complete